ncbi:hypothetical protein [Parasitella parasitica]|uniref:XPG N-terminal domain-containing protein n=1 Tax=Parasitella parasitica TaxID=35722 RepID=A0A0B7NGF0_9FUNG|nr:hypothetical protein [Parasitella parasitica]
MGVQGLWSLVGPAARPTQLESLRQKRVAVDASIWIHQFMRTMRDKEGNALQNGHLMGFFRRICKLLFFNIKPVFVFDGGAPSLKKNTIRERRQRREGVRANLKVTAKKILSAQVKSRVLYQAEQKIRGEDAALNDQDFIYYDAAKDVLQKKRKLDQFELPKVENIETRLNKLDPRLSTNDEIRDFVNEFNPNDLDIDSEAFFALPPEVQYEVIQDLMWKSRSTSWARLDDMVRESKTALDFSKQQIKLLKHRHKMSQRLMEASSASSGTQIEPTRVAGERGRQYVLYKNEDISQGLGWKLPGLSAAEPVILDAPSTTRHEPKLEVPSDSGFAPKVNKPVDKVAAAMEKNPELAALFDNLLDSDDDEDGVDENKNKNENEEIVIALPDSADENQPLFENSDNLNNGILNDINAYMVHEDDYDNDAAITQVISRIYDKEEQCQETFEEAEQFQDNDGPFNLLDANEFFDLWLSRVPDAFLYLHSFNDEYKTILRKAINEADVEQLSKNLQSIRKQFGKTNESDELTLEALQFHESFLESTYKWKEKRNMQAIHLPPAIQHTEENIIVDENDEDEDIKFMDASLTSASGSVDDESSKSLSHVHLDILQSSLHPTSHTLSVATVNNQTPNSVKSVNNVNDNARFLSQSSSIQSDPAVGTVVKESLNEEAMMNEVAVEESVTGQGIVSTMDQGYNSEDEAPDIRGEEDEYARFVSDIASKKLEDVRSELHKDLKELNKQQRKDQGNAEDITDQMVRDIQELLKLFGIPYLVSPMEAEAQCATLEALKLVDGTVTDDSDAFLFGASRIYKNMFNQQRYVECYLAKDIEREMLLSRKKLIQLAFLLGSDYTEGIPGVGPVAAMEILSEFSEIRQDEEPLEAPLQRFKQWYDNSIDETPFQRKFRKRHDALDIPDDFPNPLVIAAYYHPNVDDSAQKFEWGQPQLDSLRIFLMEAFGWPEAKADQVLLPVLREMNSRKVCLLLMSMIMLVPYIDIFFLSKATGEQSTIGSFFDVTGTMSSVTNTQGNKHSSKRVQNIVDRWRTQKKRSNLG